MYSCANFYTVPKLESCIAAYLVPPMIVEQVFKGTRRCILIWSNERLRRIWHHVCKSHDDSASFSFKLPLLGGLLKRVFHSRRVANEQVHRFTDTYCLRVDVRILLSKNRSLQSVHSGDLRTACDNEWHCKLRLLGMTKKIIVMWVAEDWRRAMTSVSKKMKYFV